jgi:hypothetical protein
MKFQEVLFTRIETLDPGNSKEENTLTISFQRERIIKEVNISQEQADMLNAGRADYPGNTSFTLFIKDGDPDPEPIVKTYKTSGQSTPVDDQGNLITGSRDFRGNPWKPIA